MPEPQLLPLAGTLFRRRFGPDLQKLVLYLFVAGAASIPIAVIVVTILFKLGHASPPPLDDPHVGWVEGPQTRGTLNIITSCLSTTFTCVYVSIHSGIPEEDERISSDLVRRVLKFVPPKICWILANIFAPELMMLVALCERWSASSGVAFMKGLGEENWTMQLAFFADMGGFALHDDSAGRRVFNSGLEFYEWFALNERKPRLNFKEIELDISDRSKRNGLLKMITCLQATWLLIQTFVRFAQHQPVSELEVTTCGYVVCAIILYGCWFNKPYDVQRRIVLRPDFEVPVGSTYGLRPRRTLPENVRLPIAPFPDTKCFLFNGAYDNPDKAMAVCCNLSWLAGAMIGIMHAVPFWNAHFVNSHGLWIWRACTVVQVSLSLGFAFVTVFQHWDCAQILWTFLISMVLVYDVSRSLLFFLICSSFQSQPVGVYQNVHWALSIIPHWG